MVSQDLTRRRRKKDDVGRLMFEFFFTRAAAESLRREHPGLKLFRGRLCPN